MTFVQRTNVYVWKERLFGKPGFKPSALSIYDNGKILWENEEGTKQKGHAHLAEIFAHIRVGVLDNEAKRERASEENYVLAYHTLVLPLEITKPTVPSAGLHEREFAVGFEREIFDWMQTFAKLTGTENRFKDVVRRYRLRKKYNVYCGSLQHGLEQFVGNPNSDACDEDADEEEDPARLWSAAHGANEDYAVMWSMFLELAIADMSNGETGKPGFSCVKCWQG